MVGPRLSMRGLIGTVTGLSILSVLLPATGVVLFAFSGMMIGMWMVRQGVRSGDDRLAFRGTLLCSIGYVVGALLLALFAALMRFDS